MLLRDTDDNYVKRTRVNGYYKRNQRGRQIFVSPHYRVLINHKYNGNPPFKRKFLIKIPKSS